jgi:hypothetical protein
MTYELSINQLDGVSGGLARNPDRMLQTNGRRTRIGETVPLAAPSAALLLARRQAAPAQPAGIRLIIHPRNNRKQERNMTTELKSEIHSPTRELTIDELKVVSGGAGRIVIRNVFDDPFFNPSVKIVEKD